MAHRQDLEDSELPNLTRQFGELVVVDLAKKSVLTRRGEAAAHEKLLERPEATDLRRNRGQAVATQLHSNASAKRANRRRRRTLKDVSCVMTNTPAGISVKALKWSWWRMGQRNDTKTT